MQVRARRPPKPRGRALWDNLMRRVALRREYVRQYRERSRTQAPLALDRDLPAQDIVLFRRYAQARVGADDTGDSVAVRRGGPKAANIFKKVQTLTLTPTLTLTLTLTPIQTLTPTRS